MKPSPVNHAAAREEGWFWRVCVSSIALLWLCPVGWELRAFLLLIFVNPELLRVLWRFLMWKVEFCVELMDSHWPHGDTRPAVASAKFTDVLFYSLILNPRVTMTTESFHSLAWA